jgi:peptidoglycan/xylan/chitin deacetylase (PgdA/CDA1 family)
MKIRLQPIRVFCFHQVSDTFDESTMKECDWLQTETFKNRLETLRLEGYKFISLQDAHDRIKKDHIRISKYAVLTADDGWASLKNILPWLSEQQIPITIFLNPAYLDGKHFRERDTEKYLMEDEVRKLHTQYPLLTIGSHGWEHIAATNQTQSQFIESVNKSVEYLSKLPNFVPYFAYTWGWNWINTNEILWKSNLTPVKLSGVNYNDFWIIRREPLDKIE